MLPRWRADLWAAGLVLLVAVGIRLAFFPNAPVFFEGDARGYFIRAVEIASGEGFNFTLKRTPGYSLLLAAVFAVVGRSLDAAVVVQHALGAGTALLAYACARRIAGWPAGLIAGLATALSGSSLIYEHVILSEAAFGFFLLASTWLLVIGLERPSLRWLTAAGLVAGIGAMVRPVGLAVALVVPVIGAVLFPSRRGLVAGAVFAAAFGLVLAPWVLRNALVHGEAAPVHPGRFLIERTVKRNQTGVSMYAARNDPDEPSRLRSGRAVVRAIEPEQPNSFEIHAALVRRLRLDDAEASDLMWELAVDAIRHQPGIYLRGTWLELVGVVYGRDESVEEHTRIRRSVWRGEELASALTGEELETILPAVWPGQAARIPVGEALAHVYQPSRWIALLLLGGVLAGAWGVCDPARRTVLVPLGVAGALVICSVAILGAVPRYRYPLDPLLHIGAAAGLVWTVRAGRLWARGRRATRWWLSALAARLPSLATWSGCRPGFGRRP